MGTQSCWELSISESGIEYGVQKVNPLQITAMLFFRGMAGAPMNAHVKRARAIAMRMWTAMPGWCGATAGGMLGLYGARC